MKFSVNPHHAYLNSNIQLSNNSASKIEVSCEQLGTTWDLEPHKVISNIHVPSSGVYTFVCSDGYESQSVDVEDAVRLGGSNFRKTFAFEKNPWFMVSMHDRTYFYNRDTKEQYCENDIAPDKVLELNEEYLLFTAERDSSHGALYSTNRREVIRYVHGIIAHNELYIVCKNEDKLEIVSLSPQIVETSMPVETGKYALYNDIHSVTYLSKDEKCIVYDIVASKEQSFDAKDSALSTFVFLDIPYLAEVGISSISLISLISFQKKFINTGVPIIELNGISLKRSEETPLEFYKRLYEKDSNITSIVEVKIKAHKNVLYFEKKYYDYKHRFDRLTNGKHTLENSRGEVLLDFGSLSPKFYITEEYLVASAQWYTAFVNEDVIIVRRNARYFQVNGVGFYYTQRLEENKVYSADGILLCTAHNEKETNILRGLVQVVGGWFDFTRRTKVSHKEYKVLSGSNTIMFYDNENACYVYTGGYCRLLESSVDNVLHVVNLNDVAFIKKGAQCYYSHYNVIRKLYDVSPIVLTDFDSTHYTNALFTDTENVIICKEGSEYIMYNIKEGTKEKFDNTNFVVKGLNGYQPIVSFDAYRRPVLKDPVTLSFATPEMLSATYGFVSPSCRYQSMSKKRFRNKTTGQIVSFTVKFDFLKQFHIDYGIDKEKKEEHIENRRKFFNEHKDFFEPYLKSFSEESKKDGEENICQYMKDDVFAQYLFNEIITIFDTKTQQEIEIEVIGVFMFLNYISFSYDDRYVAIAGRYPDGGNIGGYFGLYDIDKREMLNSITSFDRRSLYAVWITAFTKDGKVAFYTSNPDTYICNPCKAACVNQIQEKNFLCYSADGKYMALSNQGYIRYDADDEYKTWGHQKSTKVYLYEVGTLSQIKVINCMFGDKITGSAYKTSTGRAGNVAFVAFSRDNKSILISSEDGVVLVYNLHL